MLSENMAAKTDVLKVIIAGDWNNTLKQLDKYGGIVYIGPEKPQRGVANYVYIYI